MKPKYTILFALSAMILGCGIAQGQTTRPYYSFYCPVSQLNAATSPVYQLPVAGSGYTLLNVSTNTSYTLKPQKYLFVSARLDLSAPQISGTSYKYHITLTCNLKNDGNPVTYIGSTDITFNGYKPVNHFANMTISNTNSVAKLCASAGGSNPEAGCKLEMQ